MYKQVDRPFGLSSNEDPGIEIRVGQFHPQMPIQVGLASEERQGRLCADIRHGAHQTGYRPDADIEHILRSHGVRHWGYVIPQKLRTQGPAAQKGLDVCRDINGLHLFGR